VEAGEVTTVAQLAELFGIGAATARKHVATLVDLKLLVRLPHRQLGRGRASLDDAAVQLGVAGVGALQRSGHETERELRRAELVKGRRAMSPPQGSTTYAVKQGPLMFIPQAGQEAKRPERRTNAPPKIAATAGAR
jgi:hypothetical protein